MFWISEESRSIHTEGVKQFLHSSFGSSRKIICAWIAAHVLEIHPVSLKVYVVIATGGLVSLLFGREVAELCPKETCKLGERLHDVSN